MRHSPSDAPPHLAATGVTLLGLGLALTAAFLALDGGVAKGFVFLIGAGLADLFDGWVARRFGASASPMGVQLDSLVDVVSFGVVPLVLVLAEVGAGPGSRSGLLALVVGWIYVSCAILRLARFNLTTTSDPGPVRTYQGLPVTYAALVLPVIYAAGESLESVSTAGLLLVALLAQAVLFVSTVPVPKPRGLAYPLFLVLAVIVSWYLLFGLTPVRGR